jgi:hypothetical protein
MMAIRVAAAGASADAAQMTLELAATPWVDPARMAAARLELAKRTQPAPSATGSPAAGGTPTNTGGGLGGLLGGIIGGAIGGDQGRAIGATLGAAAGGAVDPTDPWASVAGKLQFEPLIVSKAALWLALPGGAAGGLVERTGAQVEIRAALFDSETLPLAQFQSIYDALFGGSLSLMRGEIRIDLGDGKQDRIPFAARLDDTNGDLLQMTTAPGPDPGSVMVTLDNAIEGPVTIPRLAAELRRGDTTVPAVAAGIDLPCEVPVGQHVVFALRPAAQLPGSGPVEVLLDISEAKVKADPEKIWTALLDPTTPADYARAVTVQAVPGMFDGPADHPEDKTLAILVQFESGATVQLTPDKPEATTSLRQPLADVVLRRGGVPTYRYRCQVVRRSGRIADQAWRSDSFDILIPGLPAG